MPAVGCGEGAASAGAFVEMHDGFGCGAEIECADETLAGEGVIEDAR